MSLNIPNLEDISKGANTLRNAELNGVRGVMEIKGQKPGPRLYLGTGTHGDEWIGSGLVVPFLKQELQLVRGSIVIAINNLLAFDKRVRKLPNGQNFNRMPADIMERPRKEWTAIRMQALKNSGALDATHGFDAHTVVNQCDPMTLHIKGRTDFGKLIGIQDHITNIVEHHYVEPGSVPLLAFGNFIGGVENNDVPVIEVEGGGPHNDPRIIIGLINGLVATLMELEMIDGRHVEESPITKREYKIIGSQKLSTDYEVVHEYGQYQQMKVGELIARDTTEKNSDILAQPNRTLIFPLPEGRITTTSDDEFFYSEPARITQIQGIRARLK
ncbi:MAG: succinylglutamate desuccinylase/aspartoacylase family protein [Candidatus Peregrinibacteria bacterium]|nr:succinylglutamate desuccinylase/aspartoacylase family protein [Candidatus Peregrinibacteria bacterium]